MGCNFGLIGDRDLARAGREVQLARFSLAGGPEGPSSSCGGRLFVGVQFAKSPTLGRKSQVSRSMGAACHSALYTHFLKLVHRKFGTAPGPSLIVGRLPSARREASLRSRDQPQPVRLSPSASRGRRIRPRKAEQPAALPKRVGRPARHLSAVGSQVEPSSAHREATPPSDPPTSTSNVSVFASWC